MSPKSKKKTYDCIVAGLGTAGSATCMTLAQRGFSVLGIDAYRPPHMFGSHHGASRSVRRAYLEGTAYVPMALRAWELWRKLESDTGQNLLHTTGNLTIGPTESPAVSGFLSSAEKYALPYAYLTAPEVRKRWPSLNLPQNFIAGLETEAGIVLPELSITAFLTQARSYGADLVFAEPLRTWSEQNERVCATTDNTTYEAGRLLISAGAWTKQLLNLPEGQLTPKRVPVHWLTAPQARHFRLGEFPVNFWQVPRAMYDRESSDYQEFYTLPALDSGGWVKAAFHNGLTPCAPEALHREVSASEIMAIRSVLRQFIPELAQYQMRSEVCLYNTTTDGHFYLGKCPGSCHVFGVGLAGHGFKFAPVLGEILADLLADTTPAFDLALFSPERFAAGITGR